MSAAALPPEPAAPSLLLVIDPVARREDGESVRIARDVLSAGAVVKVCLPQSTEEMARALARRGARRPVVVGDDQALLRVVELLHRQQRLAQCPLSVVPVGSAEAVALAGSLGVPTDPVRAARAVLNGAEQRVDVLVDDGGGVVLGRMRITAGDRTPAADGSADAPATRRATAAGAPSGTDRRGPLPTWRALLHRVRRYLPTPRAAAPRPGRDRDPARPTRPPRPTGQPLRVVADGVVLADTDPTVSEVSVSLGDGMAEVVVRRDCADGPVRARARTLSVSGRDVRCTAARTTDGPLRARTWTVLPAALRLTVPAPHGEQRR